MKARFILLILCSLTSAKLFAPLDKTRIPELLKETSNRIPVAVIGSGPAGLSAAIPPARSGYHTVIFQGPKPLGELSEAQVVENWPGVPSDCGTACMQKLETQVKNFGVHLVPLVVDSVDFSNWPYKLTLNDGATVYAFTVILATGSTQRKLGIPGEAAYWGKGLFSCGLCDGSYARGSDTAVIGGSDIAIQRALQLACEAKSITLIVPGPRLTAHESMQEKIRNIPCIKVLYNKQVQEIVGTDKGISHVVLFDPSTQKTSNYSISSIFLSTELTPNTELVKGKLPCTDDDCIALKDCSRNQQTSIEGIMAAGTVCDANYRQIGAIIGDGTKAGMDALHFLSEWGFDVALRPLARENLYQAPTIPHPLIKNLASLRAFDRAIASKNPVLVEFYAKGCPSCKKMEGPLSRITQEYSSDLTVFKVERDALYKLIEKNNIELIPAFLLFKNGKEIKRIEGETTLAGLRNLIKSGFEKEAKLQALQKK